MAQRATRRLGWSLKASDGKCVGKWTAYSFGRKAWIKDIT